MDLLRYTYCTSTGTCYNCRGEGEREGDKKGDCVQEEKEGGGEEGRGKEGEVTLLVNFIIANSIQGTIIIIIALACFFYFFISCHALETGLLTRLFAVHTHKWQPPSRAVHVAAKI